MLTTIATPFLRAAANQTLRFGEESLSRTTPVPVPGRRYLLYVHIPFCEVLCPYCSFHRVKYQPDRAPQYFTALRDEIRHYATLGFEFSDVYVGGGTPTVNLVQLQKTLDLIHQLFNIQQVSIETNPNHLNDETFEVLRNGKVNRLSVGVQSFDNDLLKSMDRYEKYGSGDDIAHRLRAAEGAFDTLNVDMIFNLPGQTQSILDRDIQTLLDTGVSQISYYPLIVANATRHRMDKMMGIPSYANEQAMYLSILDALSATHTPSSVWCFSRQSQMIDEYIIDHPEFIGVGSGAFSYLNGSLYATSFSINRYHEQIAQQYSGITRSRALSQREILRYHLLTSLFGLAWNKQATRDQLGDNALLALLPERLALNIIGAIEKTPRGYTLTRRGKYYWLVAMREFLTGVNNFRDEMRTHIVEEYEASYGDAISLDPVE